MKRIALDGRERAAAGLFHELALELLTGLVTLQAALCAQPCSFWHSLLQYSTLMHALRRKPIRDPNGATSAP